MANACEKATREIAPTAAMLQLCLHVNIGFNY